MAFSSEKGFKTVEAPLRASYCAGGRSALGELRNCVCGLLPDAAQFDYLRREAVSRGAHEVGHEKAGLNDCQFS